MVTLEHRTERMADKSKLQQMRDKLDAIDDLVDTLDVHHHEAYTSAAEKHLMKADGNLDYKKLKDGKVQEDFAQTMVDFYIEKAKNKFGISQAKKLSEEETDMLLSAYANVTKGSLLELLRENKDEFKLQMFSTNVRSERGILAQVRARMTPSATSHIQDTSEDKTDIVKEMGLEQMVDPEYMTRDQVIGLGQQYHRDRGVVNPRLYEDQGYERVENRKRREREPAGAR